MVLCFFECHTISYRTALSPRFQHDQNRQSKQYQQCFPKVQVSLVAAPWQCPHRNLAMPSHRRLQRRIHRVERPSGRTQC